MKTQPHPSDREVLAGLVERVTYQHAENGFCVIRVKARSHRDLVTVVGHAAIISAGEWITASGDWVNDRTHSQQVRATFSKTSDGPFGHARGSVELPLRRGDPPAMTTGLTPDFRGGFNGTVIGLPN
jgi:hypothetical protein